MGGLGRARRGAVGIDGRSVESPAAKGNAREAVVPDMRSRRIGRCPGIRCLDVDESRPERPRAKSGRQVGMRLNSTDFGELRACEFLSRFLGTGAL